MHTWTWTSSSIITYVALFNDQAAAAIRDLCGASLAEYRILARMSSIESTRPKDLATWLNAKPPTVSDALKSLEARKAIARPAGPRGIAQITNVGIDLLEECDRALVYMVNSFFRGVPTELKDSVVTGCVATAVQHGKIRMRNGAYFNEDACLYSFSLSELTYKITAQEYGLCFGELRVLNEICATKVPTNAESVRKRLLIGKSEMSRYVKGLQDKALLATRPSLGDHRLHELLPTPKAYETIELARTRIDAVNVEIIRPSNLCEVEFSEQLSRTVVENHSKNRLY